MGFSTVEVDKSRFLELTKNKKVVDTTELQFFYNGIDELDVTKVEVGDNGKIYVEMGKEFAVFE